MRATIIAILAALLAVAVSQQFNAPVCGPCSSGATCTSDSFPSQAVFTINSGECCCVAYNSNTVEIVETPSSTNNGGRQEQQENTQDQEQTLCDPAGTCNKCLGPFNKLQVWFMANLDTPLEYVNTEVTGQCQSQCTNEGMAYASFVYSNQMIDQAGGITYEATCYCASSCEGQQTGFFGFHEVGGNENGNNENSGDSSSEGQTLSVITRNSFTTICDSFNSCRQCRSPLTTITLNMKQSSSAGLDYVNGIMRDQCQEYCRGNGNLSYAGFSHRAKHPIGNGDIASYEGVCSCSQQCTLIPNNQQSVADVQRP